MRIAVIDDEEIVRVRLQKALAKEGYTVETYGSGEEFLNALEHSPVDLAFLDMSLPGLSGLEVLKAAKPRFPEMEIVLITGYSSIDSVIDCVRQGAFYYMAKPLKFDEIRGIAAKVHDRKRLLDENRALKTVLSPVDGWGAMIGVSALMKQVFRLIEKVAPLDCNVLIQGESGTGKELVARSIHRQSRRKDRPFVAFNCGGFTEELIASELFGYQRGAFTGATATKIGILETASGGTVFMDEIADMPLSMQGKLLRVIQERQIIRVGANKPLELDVRFIAATNKDLKKAIQEKRFREDLYFRLNVVQINLPSLMDRKEDLQLLIDFFTQKYSTKFSKKITKVEQVALQVLLSYTYPGNVRELENIVERAVALAEGESLTLHDLPPDLREYSITQYGKWLTFEEQERDYIKRVLKFTDHNLGKTAKILDLPRTTLWRKLKKYGLS
ncbi:MAG: sigma-54-dependent transcriptional regulator [Desulfomonilaceae bacterium]